MIDTIEFQGDVYPKFQAEGFAAQFAFPFADKLCKGHGVDVGCKRLDWMLPSKTGDDFRFVEAVDPALNSYHALRFPEIDISIPKAYYDFVFSSHCLEHIPDWVEVLDYWLTQIKVGGVIFLYLPDYSQKYWRPWSNRKHVNVLTPEILRDYFESKGVAKVFTSGVDLNNSFYVVCEK